MPVAPPPAAPAAPPPAMPVGPVVPPSATLAGAGEPIAIEPIVVEPIVEPGVVEPAPAGPVAPSAEAAIAEFRTPVAEIPARVATQPARPAPASHAGRGPRPAAPPGPRSGSPSTAGRDAGPDAAGESAGPAGPAGSPRAGVAQGQLVARDRSACTGPQLKRFIKSRVYVPMHELRRRFQIDGGDDEVTPIRVGGEQLYVGLPDREGRLLGELLRTGDVGYELSLDPPTPIVVGLYPMRPIPRG